MWILYLKAFHIIGFVAWFAGLFYLVRLFVYHAETIEEDSKETPILSRQYHIMENWLYSIITEPAMIFTWICGLGIILFYGYEWFMGQYWLHIKLLLLIFLSLYTFYNRTIIKKLKSDNMPMTSRNFRLYNEVATLLLVSIVLLAVLKFSLNLLYGFLGILALGLLFYIASKIYKSGLNK